MSRMSRKNCFKKKQTLHYVIASTNLFGHSFVVQYDVCQFQESFLALDDQCADEHLCFVYLKFTSISIKLVQLDPK